MIPVVLALVAAVGYGVSDFVGGVVSRRVAALRLVLYSYPLSLLIFLILAPIVGGVLSTSALVLGAVSGVSAGLAVWWFYLAMAEGPMSVVSPLTAVLVAGLPVLVGVLLGERLSLLAAFGIVLALVAVVLVSREEPGPASQPRTTARFTRRVAWLTVGSGVAFALNFVLLHRVASDTGLWPLVAARVGATAVVVVAVLVAMRKQTAKSYRPNLYVLRWAAALSVIDVVASTGLLYALHSGMLSLVSVLASLYPAVTVLLAVVVLKERVTRSQQVGMVLALGAVAMIAA